MRNGIVLTELAGHSRGSFCATHGMGASLVMVGTFIVDEDPNIIDYEPDFMFRPEPDVYGPFLKKEIERAHGSGALVGVSVAAADLCHAITFMKVAKGEGADCVSLCLHSKLDRFIETGTSAALCDPGCREELAQWTGKVVAAVDGPVIFKLGVLDSSDVLGAIETLTGAGAEVIHVNCVDTRPGSYGLEAVAEFKKRSLFLIVSGGIRDAVGADLVLRSGADAAGIGSAAVADRGLIARVKEDTIRLRQ